MRISLTFTALVALAFLSAPAPAHAKLPVRPALAIESASAPGSDTKLDKLIQPELNAHAGQSGFRLVPDGVEAFALRATSAQSAGRSLDIQYYIWHNDTTGRLLMRELVLAADRGVKVRLLLDDMDARANNLALAGLDAHDNIEVRVFNPFGSRKGFFGKIWELMTSFKRINHRMHNKSWIADNRFAIAGGRNIGDEYFSASEDVNFIDMDYAMLGPAVQDLSASFDRYWNSIAVYPLSVLSPESVNAESLEKLRKDSAGLIQNDLNSAYIKALPDSEAMTRIIQHHIPFNWTAQWQVLADDPLKAMGDKSALQRSNVLQGFTTALSASQQDVALISPYFVPGKSGTSLLTSEVSKGIPVKILTNSLAANDVAAVHAGYSTYRKPLLKGGVKLYELKPTSGSDKNRSMFGSSGASLHTKAAVFDGASTFVGSFNLDPRSVSLNCEQGIIANHPQLGKELSAMFAKVTSGKFSWQVDLDDQGQLTWRDDSGVSNKEPDVRFMQKLQIFLVKLLPVESQL